MAKSIIGTQTEKNLMMSFAGESQARMRYTYFASQAKKEGYEQIAAIFTETAEQEKEHAKRMFKYLEGGMVEITAKFPAGVIGTTMENLRAAAAGEHEEWVDDYPKFADIAWKHFNSTVEVCCRADASTYHTYYFDPKTGEPLEGKTHQGAFDDSAWARGQSWGIYGPMLTYKYKHDQKSIDTFKATTAYFLNQLPEDYVAYWDLWFTEGDVEPRDSSAASCAICGMLEAYKYMDDSDPYKQIFYNAAKRIMNSLIDNYLTKDIPESDGLLKCATYYKAGNLGIHELNTWGDYFYMEALMRFLKPDWELYW